METIKINFTDFGKKFDKENNYFNYLLRQKYNVVISKDPEFLIYSVFGMDYLNYDCIRIFYTGENITPDFNLCDYAFGFDWMTFEDRYFRLPYYYFKHCSQYYKICLENRQYNQSDIINKKFCNFIYSNKNADKTRTEFFHLLSGYKFVHSGGKYLNNIGNPVIAKYDYQKKFKFSIAFENTSSYGYTTEKIVEAKSAGTIPIYWGNPQINKEMNTKAFINCHDYSDFNEVYNIIKRLDKNNNAYLKMLNEPLFKKEIYNLNDQQVLNFFNNIIDSKKKYRNGLAKSLLEKKQKQYRLLEKIKKNRIIKFITRGY